MLLKNKNIVITGCLKGIGRRAMELFARQGANLWACSLTQTDEYENHISDLQQETGVIIVPVYFDMIDNEQIRQGLRVISSSKRDIHALVNIAGIAHSALFHMTTVEKMRQVFEINFFSQMYITQFITRIMVKQKLGNVINVSSISGMDGNEGQIAYSSSKAALIGATKTLAAELAPFNIRVNAIAPGVISTDMTSELPDATLNRFKNKMSIKRLGTPDEVACALLFLASDLSSYITGQILRVDGGMG